MARLNGRGCQGLTAVSVCGTAHYSAAGGGGLMGQCCFFVKDSVLILENCGLCLKRPSRAVQEAQGGRSTSDALVTESARQQVNGCSLGERLKGKDGVSSQYQLKMQLQGGRLA